MTADADPAAAATLHWAQAAVLIAKLQFGLGILGVPSTFYTLGLLPGMLSLLSWCAVIMYAGTQIVPLRKRHPSLADVGQLASVLLRRNRVGVAVFGGAYWAFVVLVVAAGLLTTSMALNAVTEHATCTLMFLAAAAGVTLVVGAPLHQLHRVSWLGWIGLTCIMVAVWTMVVALLVVGHPYQRAAATPSPLFGHASFVDTVNAVSVQAICLMGNVAFYAVCAEMHRPQLFTRALVVGQSCVMLHYVAVSIAVSVVAGPYIRSPVLGTAGPRIERVCFAVALPGLLVSTLLYANMASKYVHQRIKRQSWCAWLAIYVGVVSLAALLAMAIPALDQLLGLTGAALGPLFMLILTGLTGLYLLSDDCDDAAWPSSTWRAMRTSRRAALIGTANVAMIVVGIAWTVIGVYASATLIVANYTGTPTHAAFSCANNV